VLFLKLHHSALKKLGKVLVQYFGLGEVTGNITVLPPALHEAEDTSTVKVGTCGVERTGMQVSIQDDECRELAPFETGEICVLRSSLVPGLLQQSGGERESLPEWLVPDRRSGPHGPGGLSVHHGAVLGHVHLGRLERVPEGLPHVASRNGNTGLPARAIVAGGDTWAKVSRSLSAVPPWTILGTPALSQNFCNLQHRSQTRMTKGLDRRKSLSLLERFCDQFSDKGQ
jgi:AMP-binding enzyme